MDFSEQIDGYCERLGPGLWAEPANALTNLAFLAAAAAGYALWKRRGGGDGWTLALVIVVAVVGVGSGLFHTVATRWAALADVIPIAVFIHLYVYLAMRRLVGLGVLAALAVTVVFAVGSPFFGRALAGLMGGSAGYAPALAMLIGTSAVLVARGRPGGRDLLAAAALFAVSLGFRIADAPLCGYLPIGTHLVWHLLNAALLYVLVRAMIAAGRPTRPTIAADGDAASPMR